MNWPSDFIYKVIQGDCFEVMKYIPDEVVQCLVTSPPYWGLRDYGVDGQIGLEPTPELYVEHLVSVFREVRRVLRDDGTVWLNLGDSYSGLGSTGHDYRNMASRPKGKLEGGTKTVDVSTIDSSMLHSGLKPKDLVGIPWRVAFALQADGWWLRSDIIWSKPNPMPESVTDRPTRAHEYIFLLSKSAKYYYDAGAIREPHTHPDAHLNTGNWAESVKAPGYADALPEAMKAGCSISMSRPRDYIGHNDGRNKRSVWEVTKQPFPEAHFAVYPEKLIQPCILAGSKKGDIVLDPFSGAGTTALVAKEHGRKFIVIEINPDYCEIAENRLRQEVLFK